MARPKLIIDCDPGHDDAVALILAHSHADVIGVTTVSGNAPLADTTRNALTVMDLLSADTPIHAGAARPLVGEPMHAGHVHGATGLGGTEIVAPSRAVASDGAVDYLVEETRAKAGIWWVPIGPLTNIALALRADPALSERIAGISLMGGSATVGNVTPAAEFNVWADPEAADIVFRSGARIRMCGLNLTHQLRTDDSHVEALRGLATPAGDFVANLFDYIHGRMADLMGERTSALHDPCAVLAVTHPELFEFEASSVVVELDGRHTRGMTLVDRRTTRRRKDPNVEVAYSIDSERAMQLVMSSIAEQV